MLPPQLLRWLVKATEEGSSEPGSELAIRLLSPTELCSLHPSAVHTEWVEGCLAPSIPQKHEPS